MFPVCVEYEQEGKSPLIHFFYREAGKKYHKVIRDFEPYFYIDEDKKIDSDKVKRVERGYISHDGKTLKKVVCYLPQDVRELRDEDSYEADILFVNRFLIDRVDSEKIEFEPLRKCYLDIETDMSISDYTKPIISISWFDSFENKFYACFWRDDLSEKKMVTKYTIGKKYLQDNSNYEIEYRQFSNEKDMIAFFVKYIREKDPDILTAFNNRVSPDNVFDIKYVCERMKKLGISPNLLSPMGVTYRKHDIWVIKGRNIVDFSFLYNKYIPNEARKYSLEYISEKELGVGKVVYEGNIRDLWHKDIKKLVEYNVIDVNLLVLLDKTIGLFDFFIMDMGQIGCNLKDTYYAKDKSDIYLLRHAKKKGIVLPSKKKNIKVGYKGGLVQNPIPGQHKNVAVFDLSALYPSIIRTLNIGVRTISEDGDIKGTKYNFRSDRKSMIVEILEKVIEERNAIKKKRDSFPPDSVEYKNLDRMQFVKKCFINAYYGELGHTDFRLYNKKCAEEVTATGRRIARFTVSYLKELGYRVIYGDTDSVFVETVGKNIEDLKNLENILNEKYDDFLNIFNVKKHYINIKFEKLYSNFFIKDSKKRYVGKLVYKDGKKVDKTHIVGFDAIRSDCSLWSKRIQENIFSMILNDRKNEVIPYLQKQILERPPPEEVGIPKQIRKPLSEYKNNSPWVRGCVRANREIGTNFGQGSKPMLLYLDDGVICFEKNEQVLNYIHKIDWKRMIEVDVEAKVKDILKFVGLDWSEVVLGKRGMLI